MNGTGLIASEVKCRLDGVGYLADDGLATALSLALSLGQPLLLEGEPGVGKTSAAKALARALDTALIRLQCYEGITAARRCTSGTTSASFSPSAWPSHGRKSSRRRSVHRGIPPRKADTPGGPLRSGPRLPSS